MKNYKLNKDFFINVNVIEEGGFNSAMAGLALNKNQKIEDMLKVGKKLVFKDGGHNKFLEHLMTWIMVQAPRYVWQEMDTFRLSSKNSESTMHTILNNKLTPDNFELGDISEDSLLELNGYLEEKNLLRLKRKNPEGFLQKRMWMISYKTLRNIIIQRRHHRLPHWKYFIKTILSEVKYPEFLPTLEGLENYCTWEIHGIYFRPLCTRESLDTTSFIIDAIYCPFCGKKIKSKEIY